jgi:hypothetical protein
MFKDVYLIMSEFFGDRFGPDVVCSGKQAVPVFLERRRDARAKRISESKRAHRKDLQQEDAP